MAQWLQRLLSGYSVRETFFVVLVVAVAAVAVLFVAVVEPLSASRKASADTLANRIDLLGWITARAVEARALRESLEETDAAAMSDLVGIAEIESSLDAPGLRSALTHLTPRPESRFEARFEDVSYKVLIDWLAESRRQWGVMVTDITIEATDQPDRVDVDLSALTGTQAIR